MHTEHSTSHAPPVSSAIAGFLAAMGVHAWRLLRLRHRGEGLAEVSGSLTAALCAMALTIIGIWMQATFGSLLETALLLVLAGMVMGLMCLDGLGRLVVVMAILLIVTLAASLLLLELASMWIDMLLFSAAAAACVAFVARNWRALEKAS